MSRLADGSSNTRKDSASTTVTVSGDVTFASDSAELSGQADAVLRIMRAQGFGDIQVVKDHNDIPRVVFGTLCTEVYSQ